MPKKIDEAERMSERLQVAKWYYKDRLSKTEIAANLRVSPTQVARLLNEADEAGYIKVEILLPSYRKLKEEIMAAYGRANGGCLNEVVIVPTVPHDYDFQQNLLAKAAASFFEEHVTTGNVAISGGSTLFDMVMELPTHSRLIEIYPTALLGRGPTLTHIDPFVNMTLLWAKSGRRDKGLHYVTVPPFEDEASLEEIKKENQALLKRKKVVEVFEGMKSADTVFTSVGVLGDAPSDMRLGADVPFYFDRKPDELKMIEGQMENCRATGEINYTFFDDKGTAIKELEGAILSLTPSIIKVIAASPKKRVVVVADSRKIRSLKAVLEGRLCNVLITDEVAVRKCAYFG